MNHSGPRYFDLSHFALLEISGKDAFGFLHGQITADLNELENHGWLFSAWCLPNGKVICTFIVFSSAGALFLILPSMLKDKIIKRLSMFILRSDVTVRDVSDHYALFGLSGNKIKNIISPVVTDHASIKGRLLQSADFSILELWDQSPRHILISKIEAVTDFLDNITVTCLAGERAGWSLKDIEAGIPWIINANTECFLPQMLNIDQMHGVSYKKGCYPGQEIIARLHYRGQLKKKMFLGTGSAEITPGPGDRLEDKDTGTLAGEVIDAEHHPSGGFRLLAVAETDQANSTSLVLNDRPDISVKLQPVTYPA